MYNKKDIPELEKKIIRAIGEDGVADNETEQDFVDRFTGPSSGLIWDSETKHLSLADGYIFDDNGYIVLRDAVTGPGVQ